MKKSILFLPFLLTPLFASCGGNGLTKVSLTLGTKIDMEAKFEGNSHMSKIDGSMLKSLVDAKQNFVLVAHASERIDCTCYSEWHDDVLAPYIKRHGLLVYLIEMSEVTGEGKENYGLKLNALQATWGIFDSGKLVYQHDTVDQSSPWVSSYRDFADWMDARITYPRMFYISLDELNNKYKSSTPFTIYFSRSGCGDCSYFTDNYLKEYLTKNQTLEEGYVLECDVVGIRYVVGDDGVTYGPSNAENANTYQLEAYRMWNSFKAEYGLAYSEDNPAGWDSGYVPTLFHINPSSTGEKTGDVIDGAMVLYNDSISENTISSTYFTAERLEEECLAYLKESKTVPEEDKILLGKKVGEQGERKGSVYRHEELSKYHNAIAKAFLDAYLGNAK